MPRAINSLSPRTKFAKRHYEAIALVMQHAHVIGDPARRNQWESVRNELADMFMRDNGQFKRIGSCTPVSQERTCGQGAMEGSANDEGKRLPTTRHSSDQSPGEA